MGRSPVPHHLDGIPLFADCTRRELRQLDRLGTTVHRPAGTVLATQGLTALQVVVLLSGASAAIDDAGAAVLGRGDHIGGTEVSLRRPHPRSVIVTDDVEAEVFTASEFLTMLTDVPALSCRFAAVSARTAPDPAVAALVGTPIDGRTGVPAGAPASVDRHSMLSP